MTEHPPCNSVLSGMCSFSQSDFGLNTVGHNGPTVKGVIALCDERLALWDFRRKKIPHWKADNKNGCFLKSLLTIRYNCSLFSTFHMLPTEIM